VNPRRSGFRAVLLLALAALVAPVTLAAAEQPAAHPDGAPEHPSPGAHQASGAPSDASAAGDHGGGHGDDRWLGMPRPVFLTLNLLVFFGALAWFGVPPIAAFLADKQQEIRHALAEADRQRAEAAAMESRLAAQIAELRREVDEVAARAAREGEREQREILAEAERERERLETAARTEVEQALVRARQELTAHAARLAAQLAEQRLTAGLTREDRKRIFRDNLARLESKRGQA
jgi:F-type H+-transporting ATPase subunit b